MQVVTVPAMYLAWLRYRSSARESDRASGKILSLQTQLSQALKQNQLSARFVASLVGKIISLSRALGPVVRLMTRSLYALINSRQAWCEALGITTAAKAELQFWLSEIQQFNGQNIWVGLSAL